MRKTVILGTALALMGVFSSVCRANNLAISAVSLVDKNTTDQDIDLKFTISWDNSWFTAGAPSATANWDAAWVFAKYSKFSSGTWTNWSHCTLLSTGSVAPAGSQIDFSTTGARVVGAFMRRSSAGSGSNSWANAEIRWDYGADGVADGDTVKVKLFGMEMVYVSSGSFYVGDTNNDQVSNFYAGNSGTPRTEYQITSEGAITVADTTGNLYYDDDNGSGGDRGSPIPAAFPKGFAAFYLMKYEISQRQYCEFLNTLNVSQQSDRYDNALNFNSSRNFIKKTNTSPAFFGTDADNDAGSATAADKSKLNEAADGGWTACNWLNWMDIAAFADWAALRPFTEMEFEKAARGPLLAINDEFAWGNATLEPTTTSLNNSATNTETPNRGNLNYDAVAPDGPFRVGSYATATSTRQTSGAGYYGALDLSGNLWERCATVGNATGRGFTGTHGDGTLSANGRATNSDWPGYSAGDVSGATGSGFRGGTWFNPSSLARVADRFFAANTLTIRSDFYGGRCARTSP